MKVDIDLKVLSNFDFIFDEEAIGCLYRIIDKNGDILAGGDSVSACIDKFFSEKVMHEVIKDVKRLGLSSHKTANEKRG